MLSLLAQTKTILKEFGLRPQKRLGQSFLVDANILNKILEAAQITPDDIILEIGPGTGVLTGPLLERAGQVIAVEYDKGLYGYLQEKYKDNPKLVLVHGDYLKVDLGQVLTGLAYEGRQGDKATRRQEEQKAEGRRQKAEEKDKLLLPTAYCLLPTGSPPEVKLKVVSNLPYYISTPLLFKLLEERGFIDYAVLMLQKEVVARLAARPGTKDYGALTVNAALYSQIENLFTVSRHSFYPAPEVDSAVIKLTFLAQPKVELKDEELFHQVVRAAFAQRRKTLYNALKEVGAIHELPLQEALDLAGINGKRRGETLSLGEFARLANTICRLNP